jgi:hypothetical protein
LQMFLDEAIWRLRFKTAAERIDHLIALNTYHSWCPDLIN